MFIEDFPGKVLIPVKVKAEAIGETREGSKIIARLIEEGRIIVKQPKNTGLIKKIALDFSIDAGEAAALALALEEKEAIIATDDRNAIRACKLLRLNFITALAVLIRAVEKGHLTKEEGLARLGRLRTIGRYGRAILQDAERRLQGGK